MDTTLKAVSIVLKEQITKLREELTLQALVRKAETKDDMIEICAQLDAIGEIQGDLDTKLVDVEIFARVQPERTTVEIEELTQSLASSFCTYDEMLADQLEDIDAMKASFISLREDQNAYKAQTTNNIDACFIQQAVEHGETVEKWLKEARASLVTMIKENKADIIGDLLTRLKGEPGRKGDTGETGPTPNHTNEVYKADEDYLRHDVVWKDGHSFIALTDQPQGVPGESKQWAKYAMRGKSGRRGLKGERGAPGKDGIDALSKSEIVELIKATIAERSDVA